MARSNGNSGFQCMECGKRFRSAITAERAIRNGCPGCGGVDIDIAVPEPKAAQVARNRAFTLKREPVLAEPTPQRAYDDRSDARFAQAMRDAEDESLESLEAADEILKRLLGGEIVTVY